MFSLKKSALVAAVAGAVWVALSAVPAQAAQLFNFEYSFPGSGFNPTPVSASGQLTTTES